MLGVGYWGIQRSQPWVLRDAFSAGLSGRDSTLAQGALCSVHLLTHWVPSLSQVGLSARLKASALPGSLRLMVAPPAPDSGQSLLVAHPSPITSWQNPVKVAFQGPSTWQIFSCLQAEWPWLYLESYTCFNSKPWPTSHRPNTPEWVIWLL